MTWKPVAVLPATGGDTAAAMADAAVEGGAAVTAAAVVWCSSACRVGDPKTGTSEEMV